MNGKFQAALDAAIAKAVAEATAKLSASQPKADPKTAKRSGTLAKKDAALLRGFARKGIKNVVLMDRTDPSKDFNVRPFKAWVERGRIVKKGEHGVRGLFHVDQTEELPKAVS